MDAMTETVFLVGQSDDTPISQAAESWGLATRTFPTGRAVLEAGIELCKGCLVTELQLFDMSGIDLLEKLKEQGNILPAFVLTKYADVSSAVKAMQQGATEVLEIPCSEADMSMAIRDAIQLDREQRDTRLKAIEMRGRLAALGSDEKLLVEMILEGVTNKSIARRLNVSIRTVENRRSRLHAKMGAKRITDLVQHILLAKQP